MPFCACGCEQTHDTLVKPAVQAHGAWRDVGVAEKSARFEPLELKRACCFHSSAHRSRRLRRFLLDHLIKWDAADFNLQVDPGE